MLGVNPGENSRQSTETWEVFKNSQSYVLGDVQDDWSSKKTTWQRICSSANQIKWRIVTQAVLFGGFPSSLWSWFKGKEFDEFSGHCAGMLLGALLLQKELQL